MKPIRVVIVGGGFGAVQFAKNQRISGPLGLLRAERIGARMIQKIERGTGPCETRSRIAT